DREPIRGHPSSAIVYQRGSKLVSARGLTEFDSHHLCRRTYEAFEDVMRFATDHRDRVRVEVETGPVTRLGVGTVIVDIDRGGIIDDRLQTFGAHECSGWGDAEITQVIGIGRPGR